MKQTMILIPGWGGNEVLWQYQIERLRDFVNCKVIILDKQKSRDEMVEYILQEAPVRFILAGQSMGGWISMKVAAKAPERVSKLILMNTWASPDPKLNALQKEVLRDLKNGDEESVLARHLPLVLHPKSLSNPDIIEKMHQMFSHSKPKILIDQMQAMLDDYTSLPLLNQIQCPTLIIHGKEDQLFPTAEQEIIHKRIKNSELKTIEKCGHCSPIEQPEETFELIKTFILKA